MLEELFDAVRHIPLWDMEGIAYALEVLLALGSAPNSPGKRDHKQQ